MKSNETPGHSRALEGAELGFVSVHVHARACEKKLKELKHMNVSEGAAASYIPAASTTGHQAEGLELHNWTQGTPCLGEDKACAGTRPCFVLAYEAIRPVLGFICHPQQEARMNTVPFFHFLKLFLFSEKHKMAALGQIH